MRKIDVECLARLSKKFSLEQIEAGIYVAGTRAVSLGKKPGSLAYFEGEITKIEPAGIQNLSQYISYAKKKFTKAKVA